MLITSEEVVRKLSVNNFLKKGEKENMKCFTISVFEEQMKLSKYCLWYLFVKHQYFHLNVMKYKNTYIFKKLVISLHMLILRLLLFYLFLNPSPSR